MEWHQLNSLYHEKNLRIQRLNRQNGANMVMPPSLFAIDLWARRPSKSQEDLRHRAKSN